MFIRIILPFVCLDSFFRGFHVSSCDTNCADKPVFTPSKLVVKYGDPTSASCSVCQHACNNSFFGLEKSVGVATTKGTTILWTVDSMNQWGLSAVCFYNEEESDKQCCSTLPVTVYKLPDDVSISFVNHTGPMFEGHQYTLQCAVQDVAPVSSLTVTFYRGQTALGQLPLKNNPNKKPVTDAFTLDITADRRHDGGQYWCEARLELGPEGPQLPPVVKSQNITTTVYYKPQILASSHPDPITITEGNPLELDCLAVGHPSPSYTWTLPLATTVPTGVSVLAIKSVTPADGGQYSCTVSNDVGTVTVTFTVVVQGLELTSTRPPPTTTPTTTTKAPTTTTTSQTTVPSSSTSSMMTHRFLMCWVLLSPALV